MTTTYRSLTADEILALTHQGCFCDDWNQVTVSSGFQVNRVHGARFSGKVSIGDMTGDVGILGKGTHPSGIYRSHLQNCVIGDNVLIDDVGCLGVSGNTCFGNGIKVSVVNESGGRAIPIYDHLSAPMAYLMAFYRQPSSLLEVLDKGIQDYAEKQGGGGSAY